MSSMNGKLKIFGILLLMSPFFWWTFSKPLDVLKNIAETPKKSFVEVKETFSDEWLAPVNAMRVPGTAYSSPTLISSLFYNKLHVVMTKAMNSLSRLEPGLYFTSGALPAKVEAIPLIFFPMALMGLAEALRASLKVTLGIALLSAAASFIVASEAVIMETAIFVTYLYLIALGIKSLPKRWLYLGTPVFLMYVLFVIGRTIWRIG